VKREGSFSFLVGTISNVLVMEIGWTDVGSRGYILVSYAHSNTSIKTNTVIFNAGLRPEELESEPPTKNEKDPSLFTGKLLIKFQNIPRNTTQVII
jgi:hypothetical protein